MRSISLFGRLVLIVFSTFSVAQTPVTNLAANTVPQEKSPATAEPEKAATQFSAPIVADYPNQVLSLTVEGADRAHFPTGIAVRIFKETVHGLTREVNSTQPVAVHLNLLVTIGGNRNYLEQVYGSGHDAVIAMSQWNDTVFSRLLVRAVRGCMLTDQELDNVAHSALLRARGRVDVSELTAR